MSEHRPVVHQLLLVAAGGAIGTTARLALSGIGPEGPQSFWWSTLPVNVLGAFLLAYLLRLVDRRVRLALDIRVALGTGVLGAFTTYSTFAVEVVATAASGRLWTSLAYAAASLSAGVTAALLGLRVGRLSPPGTTGSARETHA